MMQIPIHFESGISGHQEQTEQMVEQKPVEAAVEADESDGDSAPLDDTAYMRLKADFENLKKREQKEIRHGVDREMGAFLRKFLSIYDDLERAISYCENSSGAPGENHDLLQGICLIHKHIGALLKESGLERIEAAGKPFDPLHHEAVMVDGQPGIPPNTVTEELVSGYRYKGKLLRPAQVKVTA